MRTHFGTFRTASAITKQTAERFRLQTANSTRQIRRIIFPTSAFAPSAHAKSVSFPELFRVLLLRFGRLSLRSILRIILGGHESSPATAAYTASRHRGKRHGHAQRLRRHRADVQDTVHAARGACLAREVEQAVAAVLVLLIPRLDLGGEAVDQRCRKGVEAVEDIDDLLPCFEGWDGNLDSR